MQRPGLMKNELQKPLPPALFLYPFLLPTSSCPLSPPPASTLITLTHLWDNFNKSPVELFLRDQNIDTYHSFWGKAWNVVYKNPK